MSAPRTLLLTVLALMAFAANSVLCRLALAGARSDPASFTSVRLVSGAAVLVAIFWLRAGRATRPVGDARSAFMLWAYAACFSFAYRDLAAGTGALLLFGAVQLTMIGAGVARGERYPPWAWAGIALAFGGLVYLVLPGVAAPPPLGAALMILAGAAWGIYSLRGRGAADPLALTAGNFLLASPLALLVSLATMAGSHLDTQGLALAVTSGALTSGVGYVIWYAALRGLTAVRAAAVQLAVPPLAAAGGAWAMGEALGWRLGASTLAILGGIALVLSSRSR